MAKARRRRRPSAGPPPVRNPRREAAEAAGTRTGAATTPRRRAGEPVRPSFRGVLIRALIVAALFYPYLIYIVGETTGGALLVSLIAFVIMIPFGMLLDRWRYRLQMRRFTRERGERGGPR